MMTNVSQTRFISLDEIEVMKTLITNESDHTGQVLASKPYVINVVIAMRSEWKRDPEFSETETFVLKAFMDALPFESRIRFWSMLTSECTRTNSSTEFAKRCHSLFVNGVMEVFQTKSNVQYVAAMKFLIDFQQQKITATGGRWID
jgi:hypothetical protein